VVKSRSQFDALQVSNTMGDVSTPSECVTQQAENQHVNNGLRCVEVYEALRLLGGA
jgi:hypothetical protein